MVAVARDGATATIALTFIPVLLCSLQQNTLIGSRIMLTDRSNTTYTIVPDDFSTIFSNSIFIIDRHSALEAQCCCNMRLLGRIIKQYEWKGTLKNTQSWHMLPWQVPVLPGIWYFVCDMYGYLTAFHAQYHPPTTQLPYLQKSRAWLEMWRRPASGDTSCSNGTTSMWWDRGWMTHLSWHAHPTTPYYFVLSRPGAVKSGITSVILHTITVPRFSATLDVPGPIPISG